MTETGQALFSGIFTTTMGLSLILIARIGVLYQRHGREALTAIATVLIVAGVTRILVGFGVMTMRSANLWSFVVAFACGVWVVQSLVFGLLRLAARDRGNGLTPHP